MREASAFLNPAGVSRTVPQRSPPALPFRCMGAATFGTVGQTPAERAAEEAWQRYARTCAHWGTPAERAHTFHAALEAERKVGRLVLAHRSGR